MRQAIPYKPHGERRRSAERTGVSSIASDQIHDSAFTETSADATLGDLFNIVYRRKWLIAGTVLVSLVAAAAILLFVTPRFQAQTLILMEPNQVTIPTVESVIAGRTADVQSVRSQVEVLRSRGLAAATIDRLKLNQDPEFNSRLRSPGLIKSLLSKLRPEEPGAGTTNHSAVVDAFLNRLDVEAVNNSRVLSVVFTSIDAEKAALITNTLADQYLLSQLETKFAATSMTNSWLNERVGKLRNQVATSEEAVEDFRNSAELLQAEGVTLTAQQIAELNAQLVLARAAEAEAEARLRHVTGLIESPDGVSTASEVLDSPLIQRLKEEQSAVERRVAELSAEYGPSHPRMIQLMAEAEGVAAKIDAEVNKIVRNLSNEVAIAGARETSLERELDRLKENMAQANEKQIKLRALEREAEANRALLATLLARYKEISSQDEMRPQQADARIISRADAPSKPSYPNKTFILGIAIPFSGLLALIAAFVLETLQRGFISGRQIENETGVTSLGFVPLLRSKEARQSRAASDDGRGLGPILPKAASGVLRFVPAIQSKPVDRPGPADYIINRPRSAVAHALRTVFWSLSIAAPDNLRTVVVTSSHPDEGKTTIALGMARTQAVSGKKTLLIDADTRNPAVHKTLDAVLQPGLSEILTGDADASKTIREDVTGLHFITAGRQLEDPLPLLDSNTMGELLRSMTEEYDLVIIDTPPVMAALDACALSRMADTTLMVVRWSRTRRAVVKHALGELTRSGGHLAGALLNMVDVVEHAKYLYGDSGAYHGRLSKYYSETD